MIDWFCVVGVTTGWFFTVVIIVLVGAHESDRTVFWDDLCRDIRRHLFDYIITTMSSHFEQ
jgi:hypothetical protein